MGLRRHITQRYLSPGLAAFCGAALLVIWGLAELVGVCGSRFYGEHRR